MSHDPLTGLFNRARFEEELAARLAESHRHHTRGAVVTVALDPVGETFGPEATDAVVRAVGEGLSAHTRQSDMVARVSDDQFALLLIHAAAEGALRCASLLLERIAGLVVLFEGHSLRLGASVGVALFPQHGSTVQTVLASSDRALRESRCSGPNQITLCGRAAPLAPWRAASMMEAGLVR